MSYADDGDNRRRRGGDGRRRQGGGKGGPQDHDDDHDHGGGGDGRQRRRRGGQGHHEALEPTGWESYNSNRGPVSDGGKRGGKQGGRGGCKGPPMDEDHWRGAQDHDWRGGGGGIQLPDMHEDMERVVAGGFHRKARGNGPGRDPDDSARGGGRGSDRGFPPGDHERGKGGMDRMRDCSKDLVAEKGKGKDKDKGKRGEKGKDGEHFREGEGGRERGGRRERERREPRERRDWQGEGDYSMGSARMHGGDDMDMALAVADDDRGVAESIGEETGSSIAEATRMLMDLRRNNMQGENPSEVQEILEKLRSELQHPDSALNPGDLADLAYVLGKLYVSRRLQLGEVVHSIMKHVAQHVTQNADQLTPLGISNIAGGFANFISLSVRSEPLMSVMAAEIVEKISEFEHRHLSQTAWAFAKCSLWNETLVSSLAGECMNKMETFVPHSLCRLSWAMAQWATQDKGLSDAVADQVYKKIGDCNPNAIATITFSFSSLKVQPSKNPLLYKAISETVIQQVDNFKPQDLGAIVWGYSKLAISDDPLFQAMAAELTKSFQRRGAAGTSMWMASISPSEICDIAWAFSQTKNYSYQPLLGAISNEARDRIHEFTNQDIANLMWSFAVAQVQHKPLMSEIGSMVALNIEKYNPQHLASIARAFGALLLKHSHFMDKLADHVNRKLSNPNMRDDGKFKSSHFSNMAYAFAALGIPCEGVLQKMAPVIQNDIAELRPMFLARAARAFRVMSVRCPDLMTAVAGESVKKLPEFATRDLQRVVDSLYVSPALQASKELETELDQRMAQFGTSLAEMFQDGRDLTGPNEEYRTLMNNSKEFECSLTGAGAVLSQMSIALPSREFIRRCYAQANNFAKNMNVPDLCAADQAKEYTAAEIYFGSGSQETSLHHWVIHFEGLLQGQPSSDWLGPPDTSWRSSRNYRSASLFMTLADVRTKVASDMAVDMTSAEARADVRGSVDILCTLLPDASSLGALRHLDALFPNVQIRFAEQIVKTSPGTTDISSCFHP